MQDLRGTEMSLSAADSEAIVIPLRPRRRADVRTHVIDGETVVLDRREEFIHQFNKTASYIWERCDGMQTAAEISRDLCETFEVDAATAERDVAAVIERLCRARLLEGS